jgi:hypothetical protein
MPRISGFELMSALEELKLEGRHFKSWSNAMYLCDGDNIMVWPIQGTSESSVWYHDRTLNTCINDLWASLLLRVGEMFDPSVFTEKYSVALPLRGDVSIGDDGYVVSDSVANNSGDMKLIFLAGLSPSVAAKWFDKDHLLGVVIPEAQHRKQLEKSRPGQPDVITGMAGRKIFIDQLKTEEITIFKSFSEALAQARPGVSIILAGSGTGKTTFVEGGPNVGGEADAPEKKTVGIMVGNEIVSKVRSGKATKIIVFRKGLEVGELVKLRGTRGFIRVEITSIEPYTVEDDSDDTQEEGFAIGVKPEVVKKPVTVVSKADDSGSKSSDDTPQSTPEKTQQKKKKSKPAAKLLE